MLLVSCFESSSRWSTAWRAKDVLFKSRHSWKWQECWVGKKYTLPAGFLPIPKDHLHAVTARQWEHVSGLLCISDTTLCPEIIDFNINHHSIFGHKYGRYTRWARKGYWLIPGYTSERTGEEDKSVMSNDVLVIHFLIRAERKGKMLIDGCSKSGSGWLRLYFV